MAVQIIPLLAVSADAFLLVLFFFISLVSFYIALHHSNRKTLSRISEIHQKMGQLEAMMARAGKEFGRERQDIKSRIETLEREIERYFGARENTAEAELRAVD